MKDTPTKSSIIELEEMHPNRKYLKEDTIVFSNGCYLRVKEGELVMESLEDDTYFNGKMVYEDDAHPGMYYMLRDSSIEE